MERVEDQEQTIEIFENDIQMYLSMFCKEQKIEDMKKESQAVWNAALMYIKRHVFNNKSILKASKPLEGYVNNNYDNQYSKLNDSNCNAYDYDKLNSICDYYIYICSMYDKEVSINGFCYLTGIEPQTVYNWGDKANKLSTASFEVFEKLYTGREESLSAKLATGNKNPVGVLAILNRHYAWNLPGVSREQTGQRSATLDDVAKSIKELSVNQSNNTNVCATLPMNECLIDEVKTDESQ